MNSNLESLKYLKEGIHGHRFDINKTNIYGNTAIMMAVEQDEGLERLKYLMETFDGEIDVNLFNDYGDTTIMMAARHNSRALKYMLENYGGKFDINIENKYGDNALVIAIKMDEHMSVKYLLEHYRRRA